MTPGHSVGKEEHPIFSSGLILHLPGEVGDFKHCIKMGEFQHHLTGNVIPGLALQVTMEKM